MPINPDVLIFIDTVEKLQKEIVMALRDAILVVDPAIEERVKQGRIIFDCQGDF